LKEPISRHAKKAPGILRLQKSCDL